jgi:hypothetical protein
MTALRRSILTATLTFVLGACGAQIEAGSRFASASPPATPLTFAWNQEGDRTTGDVRLENNPFFEERLHEAVEWELSLRGIRRGDGPPDLLIHHHLSLRDHALIAEVANEIGNTEEESYSYEEGAVVVHIVDARTGQDVWVGWGYASVEPALGGPDVMRSWVYGVVGKMFDTWPVPPRQ